MGYIASNKNGRAYALPHSLCCSYVCVFFDVFECFFRAEMIPFLQLLLNDICRNSVLYFVLYKNPDAVFALSLFTFGSAFSYAFGNTFAMSFDHI